MSMRNNFLIIGKSFSELNRYISERGDEASILSVDFLSMKSFDADIDSLRGKVNGVICVYESYVSYAAYAAERLGLPGMSPAAADICTDKFLMRQALGRAPQPISANFSLINSESELKQFAANNKFPLIIKPANLTKSLLVTKSVNEQELVANYRRTVSSIDKVYARYSPGKQPRIIIEEFLDGPAYSVDGFIDSSGRPFILKEIVDYRTGYDIGYEDNFHYSRRLPTSLSISHQKELRKAAEMGVKALGMTGSPAHIEMIYTSNGPRIIEIGARNGGYRSLMHRLANGIDIYGAALDTVLGKEPKIDAIKNESCAVLELFPEKSGKLLGVKNQSALEKLPSLVSFKLKHKTGEVVGKSSEGYKMSAIIVLHNKNRQQFEKDLSYVDSQVSVQTV